MVMLVEGLVEGAEPVGEEGQSNSILQLVSRRANSTLRCIRHSISSWLREGTVQLCSTLLWPHLGYCGQFWVPQSEEAKTIREHPKEGYEDGAGS